MNEEIRAMTELRDRLSAMQNLGLTAVQAIALLSIASLRGCDCTMLSKCCGFSTAAATGLIDRLEKLGYIVRQRGQLSDRRAVRLAVTRQGQKVVAALLEIWNEDKILTR